MTLPEHSIASNEYGRYCVPASSQGRPAARAVLAGKVWEPRTIAFVAANCGTGDVVHAGTYFGDFIPALSQALAPGARLWAFEPSAENHACAARTVALNGLENVSLFHAGLGPASGSASLHTASPRGVAFGGSSSIAAKKRPRGSYENVEIVALDDVVRHDRAVSILQLDVEGYEQKALKGARGMLARWRPLLVLETLPSQGFLAKQVLSLGYRALGTVHGNTVLTAAAEDPPQFDTFRDPPQS